jgi:hypothetical protein
MMNDIGTYFGFSVRIGYTMMMMMLLIIHDDYKEMEI